VTTPPTREQRQYFRSAGIVYLHIQRARDPVDAKETIAPTMDPIALQLMSFRARLDYDRPEGLAYLQELTNILEEMHAWIAHTGSPDGALPIAQRQSVILSGSGLEFISPQPHPLGEMIIATVTFPGYPYATLHLGSEIMRCDVFGETGEKYRVAIAFRDISEDHRDLIIKYVNHLQRKKLAEK